MEINTSASCKSFNISVQSPHAFETYTYAFVFTCRASFIFELKKRTCMCLYVYIYMSHTQIIEILIYQMYVHTCLLELSMNTSKSLKIPIVQSHQMPKKFFPSRSKAFLNCLVLPSKDWSGGMGMPSVAFRQNL